MQNYVQTQLEVLGTISLFLHVQWWQLQTLHCNAYNELPQRKFPLIKLKCLNCKISIFVFSSKQNLSDHRPTSQIAGNCHLSLLYWSTSRLFSLFTLWSNTCTEESAIIRLVILIFRCSWTDLLDLESKPALGCQAWGFTPTYYCCREYWVWTEGEESGVSTVLN